MENRVALTFVLFLLCSGAVAQGKAERRYPLSDRGALVVSVPANWAEEVRQDDKARPPTIAYRVGGAKEPQVLVTPIWPARADAPRLATDQVRKHVEQAVDGVREQAVEKVISIVEFKGKAGTGFYFDATDKAPKPGEFKFMRQGMLMLDELLVGFTILSNSRQDPAIRDAMRLLQGASRAR